MVRARAKRWRRAFGLASVASLGVALFAGTPSCSASFMDGLVGGSRDDDDDDGGGGGALTDGPELDARSCQVATAPARPEGVSDDDTSITLHFAMESVRADTSETVDSGAPPPQGLDFDGVCTCPEPESCQRPDASQSARACDGDGGRDNGLAAFVNLLGVAVADFRNDFATERIQAGLFTVFVTVRGWNGKPNDPEVTAELVLSDGFDDADGGRTRPAFDGDDVWRVDEESLLGGASLIGTDCRTPTARTCIGRVQDLNAYVRDGVLVANLSEGTGLARIVMSTPLGDLVYDLYDTTLVAKIGEVDGEPRLEGEIAGRWPSERVLTALGNVDNPYAPGTSFCQNANNTFDLLKETICASLDLASDKSKDSTNAPCTTISSALSFTASKAILGHVNARPKPDGGCPDTSYECPQ